MKEMEAKTENRYEYRKPQEKRKQMIAPDLFEFAYVPDWYGHLAELERLALPESWKFRKPSRETKNADTPILERYIHTIFRKQVIDFSEIVKLCEQYSEKVISIHSLKSTSTVIEILRTYKRQKSNKYIFHWFTGSMPQLEKAIELGCYFSINPGMLKTKSGMEVIKAIPIDHVLLETDAPFALKVQHIDEIEKELKRTMSRISDVIGFDISDIINKNSKEVFCY